MIGDGSGAIVLRGFDEDEEPRGMEILYTKMNSVGMGKTPGMWLPCGGSMYPCNQNSMKKELHYFKHDYRQVLAHGPELYFRGVQDCLQSLHLTYDDIDLFVPHQANGKVPELAEKMGIPKERVFFNFDKVGNTANASLLICLADLVEENTLPEGAKVMLVAAESTKWLYGTLLLKWTSLKGQPCKAIQRKRDSIWRRLYGMFALWTIGKLLTLKKMWQ